MGMWSGAGDGVTDSCQQESSIWLLFWLLLPGCTWLSERAKEMARRPYPPKTALSPNAVSMLGQRWNSVGSGYRLSCDHRLIGLTFGRIWPANTEITSHTFARLLTNSPRSESPRKFGFLSYGMNKWKHEWMQPPSQSHTSTARWPCYGALRISSVIAPLW